MDKKWNNTTVETNGVRTIAGGGTGASTAEGARTNLGLGTSGTRNFTTSETAPASPSNGDQWLNSANAKIYTWYSDAWIELGSAGISGLGPTDAVTFGNITAAGLNLSDTTWEDLRFPAQAINPAGSPAAPVISQTTGMLEFLGDTDCVIAGQAQMPHNWKYGSAIHPHIHLIFPTANSLVSRWKMEYAIYPLNGQGPAYGNNAYTTLGVMSVTNPNVANKSILAEWPTPITMTGHIGSCTILWRVSRLAASDILDADGSIIVLSEFDIHYEIDKLGSPEEIPS